MKNFIQPGDVVTVIAPSAVSSGDLVIVGDLFGIASYDADAGAEVEIATRGVYALPKAAVAITQGAAVYWDADPGNVTTTSTDNTFIGCAILDAADTASTVRVRLSV